MRRGARRAARRTGGGTRSSSRRCSSGSRVGDRALERGAGAERRGARELRPRGRRCSAATRSPRSTARGRRSGCALADYVALRRAGWKVSPVLEGDLRRGADEPAGGRHRAADAAAEGAAGLGAGDRAACAPSCCRRDLALAAPETAARLGGAAGPAAARGRPRRCRPTRCVVDIGVAERLLGLEGRVSRLLLPPEDAGARRCRPALAERLRGVGRPAGAATSSG